VKTVTPKVEPPVKQIISNKPQQIKPVAQQRPKPGILLKTSTPVKSQPTNIQARPSPQANVQNQAQQVQNHPAQNTPEPKGRQGKLTHLYMKNKTWVFFA
jgi:hypothetical protein